MKKLALLVFFITLGRGGVGVAFADSDGYYCVGRGYLAYQFGTATQEGPPPHLFVIRTAGPTGIPEPLTLELPRFQVHGMRCGPGWVQVAAFTGVYSVTLDEADRPSHYVMRPFPDAQTIIREFSLTQNLGAASGGRASLKPVRVRLRAKERGGGYFLEIDARAVSAVKTCELAVTSRILETDRNGREINARIIFQGRGRRECGE